MGAVDVKAIIEGIRSLAEAMVVHPHERRLEKYATISVLLEELRSLADSRKDELRSYSYALEKLGVVKSEAQIIAGLLEGVDAPGRHLDFLSTALTSLCSRDCFNIE
jgi:hypothetical protein